MDLSIIPQGDRIPNIVPVRIWTDYEPVQEGQSELRPVDWIAYVRKGSSGSETQDKVARLKKDEARWAALGPYYEAWKREEAAPVRGHPLQAWPGITAEQVRVLKQYHILSVEDLAGAGDADLVKTGLPGIRLLHTKAKAFMEARDNLGQVQAALAERDQKIEALQADLAEALEMLSQLTADQPKRGPGRPRKTIEE